MVMRMWMISVGFAGMTAGLLGGVLLWLLATRPVAVAQMFGSW
jgi:hypothetical protein